MNHSGSEAWDLIGVCIFFDLLYRVRMGRGRVELSLRVGDCLFHQRTCIGLGASSYFRWAIAIPLILYIASITD